MNSLSVIILSKTDSELSYRTTSNCIDSLLKSQSWGKNELEIIIVESNKNYALNYKYSKNITVITPSTLFGFHKYLNIGAKKSNGNFIALCNNDLIFHENWFGEILEVFKSNSKIKSFSPIDPENEELNFSEKYEIGYSVRNHIKGWCLVCKRSMLEKLGYLDENFNFYYSDNDYALTLMYNGILHAKVNKSHVEHLHKIVTNKALESKDAFFFPDVDKGNIPKHLYKKNRIKNLSNRALKDYLVFYNKWGRIQTSYKVGLLAVSLNKYGLSFFTKSMLKFLVYYTKKIAKN